MGKDIFKTCTMCAKTWQTREDFLQDKELELNGYTADFEKLELGLFYFTHQTPECQSTITLYAVEFWDLYSGEAFPERRMGKEDCPGYCLDKNELHRCDQRCECAYVREILHIIKEY